MDKARNKKSSPKNKKISPLMIVVGLFGLLLATACGSTIVSGADQNRFAGVWHLQQAGVLPENGGDPVTISLDSLESCTSPAQVTNNTPSPHFESQCFYNNVSSIRRQAFKLYIFRNEEAKARYYGSNLGRHPCRSGETPLIESDLYVMRPEANLVRKQERVERIYAKLKTFDKQAIMLQKGRPGADYTSCGDHIDAVAQQYRKIGVGVPPRRPDTAIDRRCSALQASIDSVYTDNPITPSNEAFADCLSLKESVRRDFIDSLVVLENQEGNDAFADYGWYHTEGPVVEWYRFDTVASLSMVAMHEYLHKVYFENLSSAERIKVNQEILRLIDTDDPSGLLPTIVFPQEQWDKLSPTEKIALNPYGCADTALIMMETGLCGGGDVYHNSEYSVFIDYLGQDSLNNEVMIRIGRHSPSPIDFIRARSTLENLETGISDRSQMIGEMLIALPAEIRQDYASFLLDNYGLVAFMREVREVTSWDESIKDLGGESREGHDEETGYDSVDPDDLALIIKINYDERLAAVIDADVKLIERLEEIFLSHYDGSYYYDYDDYGGYNPYLPDISQYVAWACGDGPECGDETQDTEPATETNDCDPTVDVFCDVDIDQLVREYCGENPEDEICGLVNYCDGNPEDKMCLLLEYCLDAENANLDTCLLLEYCGANLEDELCRPDWSDKEYCYEDVGNKECWPGFEEIIEGAGAQVDEEVCVEVEPGEEVCTVVEPPDPILQAGIYSFRLESILTEGYPIIALEIKEKLPSWLERHFGQFLQERQELADYFRRRS